MFNYIYLERVDSTLEEAKRLEASSEPLTLPCLIHAAQQYNGRGQFGRVWQSQKNSGLYLTLITALETTPSNLGEISPYIAHIIANTLQPFMGEHHQIWVKSPNDLYVGDKKLAGVLIERNDHFLNVGFGVNLARCAEALEIAGFLDDFEFCMDAFYQKHHPEFSQDLSHDSFLHPQQTLAFTLSKRIKIGIDDWLSKHQKDKNTG